MTSIISVNKSGKGSIQNGSCFSNTGARAVAFGPSMDPNTNSIRPVIYRIHSGYRSNRCTVQAVEPGDVLFSISWNSRETIEMVEIVKNDFSTLEMPQVMAAVWWLKLREMYPSVNTFLEPSSRGESYLPEAIWPEESDLSTVTKKQRWEGFNRTHGLSIPWREVSLSPATGLNYKPVIKPLSEMLDFNPSKYSWDGSVVGIYREEKYYWSDGKGQSMEALALECVDFEDGSNYAHSPHIIERPERRGLQAPPSWARLLVKVYRGAYTHEHCSYGVKVDTYKIKR